jgi:homoserine O-acetyltransferase/O-succinyltransferase
VWRQADAQALPFPDAMFDAVICQFGVQARTIILPVDLDRYFPPVDAEYEAQHIPNGACRVVKSTWGHMAPINPDDVSGFDTALAELLDG